MIRETLIIGKEKPVVNQMGDDFGSLRGKKSDSEIDFKEV